MEVFLVLLQPFFKYKHCARGINIPISTCKNS